MNSSLKGGSRGGGSTVVAPSTTNNQNVNSTTVVNTIFQDHPSFMLARKHQQRAEMF